MKIIERNAQSIGQSLLVSLPKEWTKGLSIKKGSKLKLAITEQGMLMISPEFVQSDKPRTATIAFDKHVKRRFIREHFNGAEKITIKLNSKISSKSREEFNKYLQSFMNSQIVEETKDKIIIKCFKIEELSIEECFKRMYYFSLNLMDELDSKDKTKSEELKSQSRKFYYMLVMQIRRFLSEGKFTKENQISLVRALDFRLAAKSIARISYVLRNMEPLSKELKLFANSVKDHYTKSFSYFINSNYEKALELWSLQNSILKKYDYIRKNALKSKNIKLLEQFYELEEILGYSHELSMYVR